MRGDNPHARLLNSVLDAVFGLLSLTLATDPDMTVFFLERPGLESFFSTYLKPGGLLRERVVHLLQVREGLGHIVAGSKRYKQHSLPLPCRLAMAAL
jgi:hypothetical protein